MGELTRELTDRYWKAHSREPWRDSVEDVIEWRQKLAAEGIKTFGPDYERDVEWPRARYAIYFQDPDGNWLEMVSRDPKPEDSKVK